MVYSFLFAFLGCGIAAAAFGMLLSDGTLKTVLTVAFAVIALIFCGLTIWFFSWPGRSSRVRRLT